MDGNALTRQRRRFGWALAVGSALGLAWYLTPGLPVW